MTTNEKNTLGDLVMELTQTEIELTHAQAKVGEAQGSRDLARRRYYDFLAAVEVSDGPAKRGRPAGSKTGVRKLGLPSAEQDAGKTRGDDISRGLLVDCCRFHATGGDGNIPCTGQPSITGLPDENEVGS